MKSKIGAGIVAGLLAGVFFGLMMQMMTVPTDEGTGITMIEMIAGVLGSTSLAVGWTYHLFNSAVIGAIFGWLYGEPLMRGQGSAVRRGALYGFAWWILGGLLLMPLFLGMPPFAPLTMAPMLPVAIGSLVGHLVYGVILGWAYSRFTRTARIQRPEEQIPSKAA
jgi:hypothetical protein